jgi:hypothetical protein
MKNILSAMTENRLSAMTESRMKHTWHEQSP